MFQGFKEKKKEIMDEYSTKDLTVYIILRFLVIVVMIRQIFTGNWNNVFLCVLTLFLFAIPTFIDKRLNIELPNALETIILLFIFAAEILGEINEFYITFKHWDTILHTLNGFLCAAIGFSLIDILNRKEFFHVKMTSIFVALVAFCFSMSVGVLWEFFEYGMDTVFKTDMQKDTLVQEIATVNLEPNGKNIAVPVKNIQRTIIQSLDKNGNIVETTIEGGYLDIGIVDTMKDLLVNFIGAVVFSVIGLLYIKNKEEYKFAAQFIPVMKKKKSN